MSESLIQHKLFSNNWIVSKYLHDGNVRMRSRKIHPSIQTHTLYTVQIPIRNAIIAWYMYQESGSKYLYETHQGLFTPYRNHIPSKEIPIQDEKLLEIKGIKLIQDTPNHRDDNLKCISNIYQNICQFNEFKIMIKEILELFLFEMKEQIQQYNIRYRYSIQKNKSIKVSYKNGKKRHYINFNKHNVKQISLYFVYELLKNNVQIYFDINCCHNDHKEYEQLLQDILFNVLILLNQGLYHFFSFTNIDQNESIKNYISNLMNIFNLLTKNQRILCIIMQNPELWQSLINFMKQLFSSSNAMEKSRIHLMSCMLRTLSYWTDLQVQYAIESDLIQHLINGMINAYAHSNQERLPEMKHNIVKVLMTMDKIRIMAQNDQQEYHFYSQLFIYKLKKIKRHHNIKFKRKINWLNFLFHINTLETAVKAIIQKAPSTFKELDFISYSRKRMIKVCGNHDCGSTKRKQPTKFRICSRCRITYYCSRKCQKRDWLKCHRYQCSVLESRLICL